MTTHPPHEFLDRLLSAAVARGDRTALIFKSRGQWQTLSWSAALEQIGRAAAGLAHLGVTPGGYVAVDGEITPRLLIVAVAARAIGAELISVPLAANRERLDALILDPRVQFVAGHGRETVAEWQRFSEGHRRVPILFDHVTPESKSPGEGVFTFQQLTTLAPAPGWSVAAGPAQATDASDTLWFAETTDWEQGLDTLLETWLDRPVAVALPESRRAADRDQAELQPNLWLASAASLSRTATAIVARLPATGRLRQLLDATLAGGRAPWHHLLRRLLRRRTGLARLSHIDLAPGQPAPTEALQLLGGLGLNLSGTAAPGAADRLEEAIAYAVAAQ
jgi:hypothetical protein